MRTRVWVGWMDVAALKNETSDSKRTGAAAGGRTAPSQGEGALLKQS